MGQADDHATLITGATGFLGGEVLARLLERDEGPVYALVRADDDGAAQERLDDAVRSLLGPGHPSAAHAIAVRGDVCAQDLGLSAGDRRTLTERVGRIVHCAASVSFTLPLAESRQINVEGTRRMLDLAEQCGELESMTHVSTAYVAGDHRGRFAETDLDVGQHHRNPYEQTKYEAELLVRERSGTVPVQVVRPSIVVGDSQTGWTPAFNVMYWPLKVLARGHYRMLPLRRSSPLDVVPVDYVADALLAAPVSPGATWHMTAGDRASTTGAVLDLAETHLGIDQPRLMPPALYRRLIHPVMVRTGDPRRRRALRGTEAFFPYFVMEAHYGAERTIEALAPKGVAVPDLEGYFDRLMDYATRAEWGALRWTGPRSCRRGRRPRGLDRPGVDGRFDLGAGGLKPEAGQAPGGARLDPRGRVGARGVLDHHIKGGEHVAQLPGLGHQLCQFGGTGHLDGKHAVPAGGPLERPSAGPSRGHPHRDPRLLDGPRLELAVPVGRQPLQAVVQQDGARLGVALLAEAGRVELRGVRRSQADPQHQATAAQAVQGHGLARQLMRAPAGQRRDHRPDGHALGGHRHRGQGDPRVGHGPHRRAVLHVVPDEEAVPPGLLGAHRKLRHQGGLAQLVERGQEDAVASLGHGDQPATASGCSTSPSAMAQFTMRANVSSTGR